MRGPRVTRTACVVVVACVYHRGEPAGVGEASNIEEVELTSSRGAKGFAWYRMTDTRVAPRNGMETATTHSADGPLTRRRLFASRRRTASDTRDSYPRPDLVAGARLLI